MSGECESDIIVRDTCLLVDLSCDAIHSRIKPIYEYICYVNVCEIYSCILYISLNGTILRIVYCMYNCIYVLVLPLT